MTDFLSGLLDRALERTPTLQRRRAAPFERPRDMARVAPGSSAAFSLPGAEALPTDLESLDVRDAPVVRPLAPSMHRAVPLQAGTPEAPFARAEPRDGRKPLAAATAATTDARHETRSDTTPAPPDRRIDTLAAPARESEPRVSIARARERPSIRSTRRRSARDERDEMATLPPPSRSTPLQPDAARPLKAEESGAAAVRADTTLTRAAPVVSAPAAAPSIAIQPFVPSPRPLVARPHALTAREAPAAPIIQVTIGRVEVRATAPAVAPAHAARPAAPKLNLDAYLRSRGGRT